MMNSSSLSRAIFLQSVALFISVADSVYDLAVYGRLTLEHILFLVALLLTVAAAIGCQISARRSLERYIAILERLARGDFEARIIHIKEKGLLRDLALSINRLTDVTDAFVREACNSMEAVSHNHYYRKVIETGLPGIFCRSAIAINAVTKATEASIEKFQVYADHFEKNVQGIVEHVSASSGELQHAAETMLIATDTTSKQSEQATTAAGQASHNVATVASAAEELSASITEIDSRVSQSAAIAAKAHQEASQANTLVQSMSQAAEKIGNVIQLINDIASQTNLLALNATIEAARAGDAGKGFSVVANEVKNLANQTAKATDEISAQVGNMQAATGKAVEAIRHIGTTIEEINQITSEITASVEEQRLATQEIANNVQQASSSTTNVLGNIEGVGRAAIDARGTSSQVLGAAKELSQQSRLLRGEVDKFLGTVRTA